MKNIVIIGGSKGIGSAILLQQLETNMVYNISRNAPDITHPNLKHFSADVLQDALPEIETIDTLIYCPGSINLKPIGSLSIDDFRNDFEINVIGAVKAIQKYLPVLKKGTNPSIVLFSTVAAKLGMPFHASIATAKAGIEGLVKSLGAELASVVRINAIAPTITETSLSAGILRNDRMKENMVERHPMKGYLKPEEVANMANFLISENAKSISGQIFEMDYGIVTFKI
ncbi:MULTISPECIES: SDR family NAD(P)-dependent oxidoreductase [unclassified Flavobacterium]|jgi:NAD(P)-dependent dehydrogenase (short-subunit alcohol dehydrogenase family)|uniref:SDR family NAD(P)-dependent oxidoreductase n=1 Tax=unclassified Flavobacterium TaxID=196869 RepID=UPI000C19E82F|nr:MULTISPECIES: SDR family oxidoreductase [unclassified Flavobacterium]MDI6050532.1 SDR family oxidoreductase [Flavobacterium sp. XS2P24]PIF63601.1 NAD(P)-dependent dehydrogenase (short-subunit alcohol dehydrogenase family) [Flavobacterium sp. 11]WKL44825.1 SDR family oxidoreductase [Flavobacterium sp. ZE23DGlu08]